MKPRLLKFLLVEDNDDHAEIVTRTLRKERVGNVIHRVVDGAQALEFLHRDGEYADAFRPDIILLDLNLPRVGGLEVLERVKADSELRSIPVVVLTTSDVETDRARAYEVHANSYLTKPMNFDRFSQMIRDLDLYWGMWNKPAEAGD